MNFHNLAYSDKLQTPFALSGGLKSRSSAPHARKGFLKVLANGDVVQLLDHKPMIDRLVRDGLAESIESQANLKTPLNNLIIESVITNLEAGVKLLDCQELALAKMGGKLSQMALLLNRSRFVPSDQVSLQSEFEESRLSYRSLVKNTFGHTALFSIGASKPIIVVAPRKSTWEALFIDRCNIGSPGLQSIEAGKVAPHADGLLLDPETFNLAFKEWRALCANNRLQWNLIFSRWKSIGADLKVHQGNYPHDITNFPSNLPSLFSNHSYFQN